MHTKNTFHKLFIGNANEILVKLPENSIQLIITSPPYWNAKNYRHPKQIGYKETYKKYITNLKNIFEKCFERLLPDGKMAINIGNIYNYDKTEERSSTINLVLDIWQILYSIKGLKFMGTIYWKKTTSRSGAVLFGSYPYPSNLMVSTALEAIHIFRKTGRRKIPKKIKEKSIISKNEFRELREPIWNLNGISKKEHPAVFPNELVRRLIKMYSFCGDTVLDAFCGIGTTNIEALRLGRNSVGIDVKPAYIKKAFSLLKKCNSESVIEIIK